MSTAYVAGAIERYRLVAAGTTNSQLICGGPCRVLAVYAINSQNELNYVKLYDKATAPTVGTDTPAFTFGVGGTFSNTTIPANIAFPAPGVWFENGLGCGITAAIGDSDTTAVTAADTILHVLFQRGVPEK